MEMILVRACQFDELLWNDYIFPIERVVPFFLLYTDS